MDFSFFFWWSDDYKYLVFAYKYYRLEFYIRTIIDESYSDFVFYLLCSLAPVFNKLLVMLPKLSPTTFSFERILPAFQIVCCFFCFFISRSCSVGSPFDSLSICLLSWYLFYIDQGHINIGKLLSPQYVIL